MLESVHALWNSTILQAAHVAVSCVATDTVELDTCVDADVAVIGNAEIRETDTDGGAEVSDIVDHTRGGDVTTSDEATDIMECDTYASAYVAVGGTVTDLVEFYTCRDADVSTRGKGTDVVECYSYEGAVGSHLVELHIFADAEIAMRDTFPDIVEFHTYGDMINGNGYPSFKIPHKCNVFN